MAVLGTAVKTCHSVLFQTTCLIFNSSNLEQTLELCINNYCIWPLSCRSTTKGEQKATLWVPLHGLHVFHTFRAGVQSICTLKSA